ncbi:DUF1015 family protein [Nocardioides bigeumensis]|uniref:DUF1015 domain-containing protein n=1 Tax=Nocardioides bigeumensis TaxID=433657 RepID=A0ABN2Y1Z2_9ACTN
MEPSQAVTPPYLATPLRLEPFRALTLAPQRVGDAAAARAFARPYREVAGRLRRWQATGRVLRDETPGLYLHEYTADGITVRGIVGALDMSRRAPDLASRAVLPHEGIYPHRAHDLAERMLVMKLNPAPILLVHRGPAETRHVIAALLKEEPQRRFTDRGDQRHRVWPIRGADLDRVHASLLDSRPVIADGHHRYAAYLQLQQAHPGTAWDRGLAMLVDQDDTPLQLGAIHRVLRRVKLTTLGDALVGGPHALEASSREAAVSALGTDTLAVTDGRTWAILRLDLQGDRSAVEAFHDDVLPALATPPAAIGYLHTADETLHKVRRDRDLAVLMPAPDFDLVHRIVAHDRLLPEKATSFQPKPSTGVLMRSVDDE